MRCPRCDCGAYHFRHLDASSGSSRLAFRESTAAARRVAGLHPRYATLLDGLPLVVGDSESNAVRVRERTGWPVLSGFAIAGRTADVEGADTVGRGRPTTVDTVHFMIEIRVPEDAPLRDLVRLWKEKANDGAEFSFPKYKKC